MDEKDKIELRSEEVQEIMGEIPSWIIRRGIAILFVVVFVVLLGSYFFRYPEVASAEMILSNQIPVTELFSRTSGRINDLYVKNGDKVKTGMPLGVIENAAITKDVFVLKEYLLYYKDEPERLSYHLSENLWQLGDIHPSYMALASKLPNDRDYRAAWGELLAALKRWEMQYCFIAPKDGIVELQRLEPDNCHAETGKLFARIIPEEPGEWIGKVLLPIPESGKVDKGQRVIVRFVNYPDQEFGVIEGRVASLSKLPFEDNYEIDVLFPEGFSTNYKKTIKPFYGMKAQVEIIKDDLRLIDHFFQPLKKIIN